MSEKTDTLTKAAKKLSKPLPVQQPNFDPRMLNIGLLENFPLHLFLMGNEAFS